MWGGDLIQRITRAGQVLMGHDESSKNEGVLRIITQGASSLPDNFPTWLGGRDKRIYGWREQKVTSPDAWETTLKQVRGKRGTITRALNEHSPQFPTVGRIREEKGTFEKIPSFENQTWAIMVFGAIANSKYSNND